MTKKRRRFGKRNEVKIDLTQYNIGLIGESGIGKTTLIYEVCKKVAGEDGYIFLECGKEDGADAIQGIIYENVRDWDMFEEITDDIIDNKTEYYPDLKIIVIDTYDQLLEIAKPEVIRMHNAEYPDKPVKSIKAAFGGYMGGEDKATEIVLDRLWDLKEVGVRFIIVGHVKQKEQEDVATGQKFTTLTTNMSMRDFTAIKTKLHFLGVASIDREIVQENTGRKDSKTKKDIMKGVVTGESRKVTFRDDNYSIDSKSRFADIVPEISLDADAFIKALEDAIKSEASKGSKSIEQLEKEQRQSELDKVKEIAKTEQAKKKQKEFNEVIDKITDYIKANKSDLDKVKPILEKCKEFGADNPTQLTDIKQAKEVLKIAK